MSLSRASVMTRAICSARCPESVASAGDKCLQIVVAILTGGTANAGPFRMGRQFHRRHPFPAIVRKHVLETGVQTVLDGRAAGVQFLAEPILAGRRALSFRSLSFFPALGFTLPSFARSRSGLRSSSASTWAVRSRLDSCSSLMACISCGVITRACVWRNCNFCVSAIVFSDSWSGSCLPGSIAAVYLFYGLVADLLTSGILHPDRAAEPRGG